MSFKGTPTTSPTQQQHRHGSGGDATASLQSRKRKQDELEEEEPDAPPLTDKQKINSIVKKGFLSENSSEVAKDMEQLSAMLWGTLDRNDTRTVAFHRGIPIVVVQGMIRHENSFKIQLHGCRALAGISVLKKDAAEAILDVGVLEACLSASKRYEDRPQLQSVVCNLIGHLWRLPEICKTVVDEGGLTTVMTAMNNNKNRRDVQNNGCFALCVLVTSSSWAKVAVAAGSIELVIAAMSSHPDDAKLQQCGCTFLSILSKEDDDYRSMIVESKGLNVVADALRIHKDSKKTVTKAREANSAIIGSK